MLSKKEVKYIQSLYYKKTRIHADEFIVQGEKMVDELLHSNYEAVKIYATEEWFTSHKQTPNSIEVSNDELIKISNMQTPNLVVATVKKEYHSLPENLSNQITLVLDCIQDPGNLGTIIRTADWFGISNIIASIDTADFYNSKVIQSTMGSFMRVKVHYTDLKPFLAQQSLPVFGAMLDGSNILNDTGIQEGFLVIGNESKGISKELIPLIQHAITIPRIGSAESLNAAVATGIILSHVTKIKT